VSPAGLRLRACLETHTLRSALLNIRYALLPPAPATRDRAPGFARLELNALAT